MEEEREMERKKGKELPESVTRASGQLAFAACRPT
jgi:hypothetical protein